MKNFTQGQPVRIKGTFRNFASSLGDPSTVTFYVQREGDGDWQSFVYDEASDSSSDSSFDSDVVRVSLGVFYLIYDTAPMSGVYNWRVVGTGNAFANAKQGSFYVEPMDPDDSESSSS